MSRGNTVVVVSQ
jgi:hypothetical protein